MENVQQSRDVNSIAASHLNRLHRRFFSFLIIVQQFGKWKDRKKRKYDELHTSTRQYFVAIVSIVFDAKSTIYRSDKIPQASRRILARNTRAIFYWSEENSRTATNSRRLMLSDDKCCLMQLNSISVNLPINQLKLGDDLVSSISSTIVDEEAFGFE